MLWATFVWILSIWYREKILTFVNLVFAFFENGHGFSFVQSWLILAQCFWDRMLNMKDYDNGRTLMIKRAHSIPRLRWAINTFTLQERLFHDGEFVLQCFYQIVRIYLFELFVIFFIYIYKTLNCYVSAQIMLTESL